MGFLSFKTLILVCEGQSLRVEGKSRPGLSSSPVSVQSHSKSPVSAEADNETGRLEAKYKRLTSRLYI